MEEKLLNFSEFTPTSEIRDEIIDKGQEPPTMPEFILSSEIDRYLLPKQEEPPGFLETISSSEIGLEVSQKTYICIDRREIFCHAPHWDTKDLAGAEDHTKWPLLTRAWVFQERLLSPRILHFMNNRLNTNAASKSLVCYRYEIFASNGESHLRK